MVSLALFALILYGKWDTRSVLRVNRIRLFGKYDGPVIPPPAPVTLNIKAVGDCHVESFCGEKYRKCVYCGVLKQHTTWFGDRHNVLVSCVERQTSSHLKFSVLLKRLQNYLTACPSILNREKSNSLEQSPFWEANICSPNLEILAFCGTRRFIIVFVRARHWSLP